MEPGQLKEQVISTLKELDQLLADAQTALDSDENVKRLRAEYDNQQAVRDFRAKVQSYNNQKTELMGALKALNAIAKGNEAAPAAAAESAAPAIALVPDAAEAEESASADSESSTSN